VTFEDGSEESQVVADMLVQSFWVICAGSLSEWEHGRRC
jgi:hypothetical protein